MSVREASRVIACTGTPSARCSSTPLHRAIAGASLPEDPKIGPYTGVIDRILQDDLNVSKKHRHTAKQIYERLRDEHVEYHAPVVTRLAVALGLSLDDLQGQLESRETLWSSQRVVDTVLPTLEDPVPAAAEALSILMRRRDETTP